MPYAPKTFSQRYGNDWRRQSRRWQDAKRGSARERGYDARWEKVRRLQLAQYPLCADCLSMGRTQEATEVHHVDKVRDSPERILDMSNLVSLCKGCHSRRTARGE